MIINMRRAIARTLGIIILILTFGIVKPNLEGSNEETKSDKKEDRPITELNKTESDITDNQSDNDKI